MFEGLLGLKSIEPYICNELMFNFIFFLFFFVKYFLLFLIKNSKEVSTACKFFHMLTFN